MGMLRERFEKADARPDQRRPARRP